MNQSLVNKHNGRVLQIISGGADARFEVHEDFMWVEGPYEVAKGTDAPDYWYYPNDREIRRVVPKPPSYDLSRRMEYPNISEQLDMLFHDMESGIVPGKDTSSWYAAIKSIKENYPKP